MITGQHHVSAIVSSERSLDFYKLLGFKETFRKERESDTLVMMSGCGMQLEFFIDPSHSRPSSEPIGLRHIALRVSGTLEEEIERLKKESATEIEVGPIREDWTGVRLCFIKDYDGISVELRE